MTEAASAPALKQKVAFVDDERTIAKTLAIILNHGGFDAHPFFSGQEAVDSLDKLQPDLLITDVMMPGLNAVETAIIFRTKLPQCKVLLFSGQAATTDLMQIAKKQGHEFEILAKPVHPTDLLAKIAANPKR
jgi:DNA-binding response OmpR family regulator